MGMAFKEISPFGAPSVFETLVEQDKLQEPVFGFYLADSDSELIIGGRNDSWYSGNLTYVDVTKQVRILRDVPSLFFNTDTMQGYWQTTFDGITANGKAISVSTQNAIIDTGTSFLLGDPESILNIYEQIPGSGQLQNTNIYTSTLFTVLAVRVVANRFTCK
jgi:cathepsin D